MRDELFNELVKSIKQGGAILRGEQPAAREALFEDPDVAAIREEYGLSQTKFAALLGIKAGATLRARLASCFGSQPDTLARCSIR
jgi:putative transcriptional regulator